MACLECRKEFQAADSDAMDTEQFCSEECENEYEPDTCDACHEELDPKWEHECPMTDCPTCGNEYNENTDDECPYCADDDDD